MTIYDALCFFGLMLALAAMPSASVGLVVTRSATLGVANGLAVSAGIVLGDLVFILLALLGLSFVAETLGNLFAIIKLFGGLYLIYLGFSLLKRNRRYAPLPRNTRTRGLFASFFSGFFLTLGDIKAVLFYASILPMLVDLSQLTSAELLMTILLTVLSVGSVKAAYAFSACKLAANIQDSRLSRVSRQLAGGMMIGAGGYVIFK